MKKGNLLSVSMAGLLLFATLATAAFAAEKYPSREIEMVTTNPPGGMVDLPLRLMADDFAKNMGVPAVVANRAGAGGATGALYLIKSKPDGYTIGALAPRETVIRPVIIPNLPYKYTDLTPLAKYASAPSCLYVRADAPWKSWADLVADAKKRPNKITYGVSTHGISDFQFGYYIKRAGISVVRVALASGQEATVRVLGGNLDVVTGSPGTITGQLKAGKVRIILLISPERMPLFPDVPTYKEMGLPDPPIFASIGFFAPVGLPSDVRETLEKNLEKTINNEAMKKKLADLAMVMEYLPAGPYTREIEGEYQRISEAVKASPPAKK